MNEVGFGAQLPNIPLYTYYPYVEHPVEYWRDAHLSMRDVNQNSTEESPYECFECGNVVLAKDNPGQCPDCAGDMRNRRTPIE